MRIGIICVVPHDGFHVKENAVDFVVILATIFPIAVDIADAAHAKQTTFREHRVGKFFLHIFRTTRHNECVVDISDVIPAHSTGSGQAPAGISF